MNSLIRTRIEKAGYASGWENVKVSTPAQVVMFSARHPAEAHVTELPDGTWHVTFPKGPPGTEILQTLPRLLCLDQGFVVGSDGQLSKLLHRAAILAMALPNQVADVYAEKVAELEKTPPSQTEVLVLAKRRIGQNLFRQALMDYWGGACAVTGIAVPALLRASHAKPWAACATDAERLNAYNGFLLCAHLDALFDRGLVTFDPEGLALFSLSLPESIPAALGLSGPIRLRWLTAGHQPFLAWHREHVFQHPPL